MQIYKYHDDKIQSYRWIKEGQPSADRTADNISARIFYLARESCLLIITLYTHRHMAHYHVFNYANS